MYGGTQGFTLAGAGATTAWFWPSLGLGLITIVLVLLAVGSLLRRRRTARP